MAKLRHIAMTVPHADLEKTIQFYSEVFDMRRVRGTELATLLTDGVMSLAIISDKFPLNVGHRGLHHIGFVVDDVTGKKNEIVSTGRATALDDAIADMTSKDAKPAAGPDHMEHKFLDPNGITFDIASNSYATERWGVSLK